MQITGESAQAKNWLINRSVVELIEHLQLITIRVDLGSIPGLVKPKTIKVDIHNFPA